MKREEKVYVGSNGKVYFDGEEMFYVQKFELKVSVKRENFDVVGEWDEFSKAVGWAGKGMMEVLKTDAFVYRRFIESWKNRKDPTFTIIGEVTNPETNQTQTAIVSECKVDGDLDIMSFEPKKLMQDKIGFNFRPSLLDLEAS
ncbi:phage tail tube protein [Aneurinibacillus migulanus]|uniref:Phage tail tube protein n=1 Tax=Aneurinibacillus migulanus TaxID=47500 RepID=A0A0D1YAR5_ANEMI|nr:phage tail tube protein [Aneurinibacillus migulanus]KIV56217.1 hypothetical protein TS65_13445 [Aneurinibacillus migulanus]KON84283.1 hypothetical protein AF333_30590 [Aneurinibacillus migulanus]MED0893833.1 phage tail tube protein [Aneurinibacillus migulanus]MED1614512.1 phage tail tube protein [Aneurinibacillus migulanus]SDI84164.1 Phage tail tube protein [Aneurinibacillus migulanus]